MEVAKYKRNFRSVTGAVTGPLPHCRRNITKLKNVSWFSAGHKSPCGHTCRLTPNPIGIKFCLYLGEFFVSGRIKSSFCFCFQISKRREQFFFCAAFTHEASTNFSAATTNHKRNPCLSASLV